MDINQGNTGLRTTREQPQRAGDHFQQLDTSHGIDVKSFISRFEVVNPEVQAFLHAHPLTCYLLGRISNEPAGRDARPDGIERDYYLCQEGSGMFGLTKPDDAMRWRGIFNHIAGSARQVDWMARRLKSMTAEQRLEFKARGFNLEPFDSFDPETLRDFMFISHAGRRQADEYNWHRRSSPQQAALDSGPLTSALLEAEGVDERLLHLLRTEDPAGLRDESSNGIYFPDITVNILTYCDWTFAQAPVSFEERFAGLRAAKRQDEATLDMLESCGRSFQSALTEIIGPNIVNEMLTAPVPEWELVFRRAYCASAGLSLSETFTLLG